MSTALTTIASRFGWNVVRLTCIVAVVLTVLMHAEMDTPYAGISL